MVASSSAAGASSSRTQADLGTRFSAFVIDAMLLFGVQWIVVIVLSRQLQAAGMTKREPCGPESLEVLCEGPNTALWVLLMIIVVASTFGYHTFFDGVAGASPGKRWMGLRVVNDSGDVIGAVPGLLRSLLRQGVWIWALLFVGASPLSVWVPGVVFLALFGLSILTFVWGAFAPDGHALHDRAVGSHVEAVVTTPSASKESLHDRV